MRKVIWSPRALDDLQQGFYFISDESPRRAHGWLEQVFRQIERLSHFPEIGHPIPELGKRSKYRQIVVGNYRVFHEVRKKKVFIFRILHNRQILEN